MVLSATRVKALKELGRYSDGGGLHLYISKAGRKSWVLRITIDGRRRDLGMGAFPFVSLAKAREKAVITRQPSRKVVILSPTGAPLRFRHSEKPRVPSTRRTNPVGVTPSTSKDGCSHWSVTPCRRWATQQLTG